MPRKSKMWYRKDRGYWSVTIQGKRHNLGPHKEEAERKYHELMANPIRPETITVFEVMDEFLEWTKHHRAHATFAGYQKLLKRYVDENKNMACSELKPYHIQKWLDKNDWGATYSANMVTALKRCFNWAREQGYVERSPIEFLKKPKSNRREKPVTREEYKRILAQIDISDPFYDLVVFSWEAGVRPQESLRFTAPDVKGAKIVMENPKARGPRYRVIHLSKKAKKIVERHMDPESTLPVFLNTRGNPWTPNSCSNRFDRMKDQVGRRVSLYDFRHGFATDMLKSGVDPVTVAELMGHKDLKMLMEIYQHIADDDGYMQSKLKKRKRA